jgi:hypothetical protein
MKQILNEWRKFLNENVAYFGEKFVEFKNATEGVDEPLDIAYKLDLKRIGEGSSRVVFELPDNKDFVLKIINTHQMSLKTGEDPNQGDNQDVHGFTKQNKMNANMYEADIQIQIENPSLFPKSTEHAEDYSWILVERVEPLTKQEFREVLGLPSDIKSISILALTGMIIEAWQNKENRDHYSHRYVAEVAETFNLDDIDEEESDINTSADAVMDNYKFSVNDDKTMKMSNVPYTPSSNNANNDDRSNEIRKNIKSILGNIQAVRILSLMAKYNIQATEFKAANLGISKLNGGKIVLLDTSMWDDKE